ncbi:molybdenum cofactor guanylyltransferase [Aeromicrobium wangtongii]|uniref:molybdenum cofactor guanylyltransferase n=1 Tax=Aeromicrobium wangtongii TaxID=2969247 RepID=UPI002016B201|nr:molybdenum cofactor guanylyltransferase [Aeromicrobium wangtongii]MCL3818900.1 molybdenum cofactor guanylyltransferase [Aeromicrobium wangtongii]
MTPATYDAIVLAGGRSSRMGGIDKTGAVVGGRTLLGRACDAVADAGRLVVVGPPGLPGAPERAITAREDPPFAGPVAAIGAGLDALGGVPAEVVVVLAADVPRAAEVVPVLLEALAKHPRADGVVPRSSDGHRQTLLAAYRSQRLAEVLAAAAPLTDLPVKRIVAMMDLVEISPDDAVVADIDTPEDLHRASEEMRRG